MAKKNKKVIKSDDSSEKPLVSKKLLARVSDMSVEEKAAFCAELGLPVKKIRVPKPKEPTKTDRFNEACARLEGQVDSLRTIIEGCEFPNGYNITIGTTAKGEPTFKCKQVRAEYAPRKDAEASA